MIPKKQEESKANDAADFQAAMSDTAMKKGFLDGAKKALYPKGSEQGGKAPPTEEELMEELKQAMGEAGPSSAAGTAAAAAAPTRPSVAVKKPELKTADFTLCTAAEGGDLQLVVSVPGLESMKLVNLDVTERRAEFGFPSATNLKPLQVELPQSVCPSSVKAKFSKKTHQITVNLPLAASGA